MPSYRASGFSLAEALLAIALVAAVAAAFVPALAAAARLQGDSEIATQAVLIATRQIESLRDAAADGGLAAGGSLDARAEGWHAFLDAHGRTALGDAAVYETRWRVRRLDGVTRAWAIEVEVRSTRGVRRDVRFTTVVPDG